MDVETWRKNGSTDTFDIITKGAMLTVEGHFRPDEWTDKDVFKAIERYADKEHHSEKENRGKVQAGNQGKGINSL